MPLQTLELRKGLWGAVRTPAPTSPRSRATAGQGHSLHRVGDAEAQMVPTRQQTASSQCPQGAATGDTRQATDSGVGRDKKLTAVSRCGLQAWAARSPGPGGCRSQVLVSALRSLFSHRAHPRGPPLATLENHPTHDSCQLSRLPGHHDFPLSTLQA